MSSEINNQIIQNVGLCNNIFRNVLCSIFAEKHDLYIEYNFVQGRLMEKMLEMFIQLGIQLFVGKNKYSNQIVLQEHDYINVYNFDGKIDFNIIVHDGMYYQNSSTSMILYNYFNEEKNRNNIIIANKFKDRYNNNNDIFIHIRLGDITNNFAVCYTYFEKAIESIQYDNIFIASDSPTHDICVNLCNKYSNCSIVYYNEVDCIHFGSTCKHVVLSTGTFSCVIGYFSFFSNVYYPEEDINKKWHGDIFVIPTWKKIEYCNTF
jgi:hypothetical protein